MLPERALVRAARPLLMRLIRRGHFANVWYPRLEVGFRGGQLAYIFKCLEKTADVDGAIIEVGCSFGHTTSLLAEYLEDRGIQKPYLCIDTFAGFSTEDIKYEKQVRGKLFDYSKSYYARNNLDWFRMALTRRGVSVEVRQADICTIRASELPTVSFCLLDVDLYRPVSRGLSLLWKQLAPGGMIVIDDCSPTNPRFRSHPDRYDGALQAYREFVETIGQPLDIREGKLGIIRKPC